MRDYYDSDIIHEMTMTVFKGLGVLIVALAIIIILLVAGWKLFKKAGRAGWKSLVPIYNLYCVCEIAGKVKCFWINIIANIVFVIVFMIPVPQAHDVGRVVAMVELLVWIGATLAMIISYILIRYNLARVFGMKIWFAIGMIILPGIFDMILAFSKNEYVKNTLDIQAE